MLVSRKRKKTRVQNRAGKADGGVVRTTRDRDTSEYLKDLGTRLRKLRTAKGFSIPKVYSANPKLSMATLSKIERGLIDPQISTLRKIARVLGVKIRELVGDE